MQIIKNKGGGRCYTQFKVKCSALKEHYGINLKDFTKMTLRRTDLLIIDFTYDGR